MIPGIRGQKLFGATETLWLVFAFTTFLGPVLAAPQPLLGNKLSRRNNEPGLGVELEMGKIVIVGKKELTAEEREKIKGAEMIPIGFAGDPQSNWKLTAEIGATSVFPEAIVDGLKNEVGEHKTKGIGEEILKYFEAWAPCRDKGCKVTIKGFDNLGPWTVRWPKDLPTDLAKYPFSAQVTAAMPLEAVLEILSDTKTQNHNHNPLASSGALDASRFKILTKHDFKSFSKIKETDITDDFLGFFSILASYCVLAHATDPKEGPKRLISIMPRTDFVAQYTAFIEPKLKDQFSDKETSLYDIIEKASGADSKLAKQTFKWKPGTITKIDDDWTGKEDDLKTGHLEVEKFLNYLQGYDKETKKTISQMDLMKLMDKTMRHGQIGNLGSKMETILGTSKHVPIFEFRELAPVLGAALGTTLGSYEDKVVEYHKKFAKRDIDVREERAHVARKISAT